MVSCWDNQQLQNIMESKVIYVTDDMQCHQIRVIDGKLIKTEQYHMLCSHEEADTRMIFHTKCINDGKVVVIRNIDTNVLIRSIPKNMVGVRGGRIKQPSIH